MCDLPEPKNVQKSDGYNAFVVDLSWSKIVLKTKEKKLKLLVRFFWQKSGKLDEKICWWWQAFPHKRSKNLTEKVWC